MTEGMEPRHDGHPAFLRPTVGTLVLLVCLLGAVTMVTSGSGGEFTLAQHGEPGVSSSWRRIGPGLAFLTSSDETGVLVETVTIGWWQLALALTLTYPLCRWIAARVEGLIGPVATRRLLVRVPIGLAVLAVLLGGAVSRGYWGYWFSRPGADCLAERIDEPTHLSFVKTGPYDGTPTAEHPFEEVGDATVAEALDAWREDPYYGFEGRLLKEWVGDDVDLDRLPPVPPADLAKLRAALRENDVAFQPDPGYAKNAHRLSGVVIMGTNAARSTSLVASLQGGELSNDHRPHYGVAFDWSGTQGPELRDQERFFYDVAGLEGMEWTSIALLIGVPMSLLLTIVTFVMACVPRRVPGSPRPIE